MLFVSPLGEHFEDLILHLSTPHGNEAVYGTSAYLRAVINISEVVPELHPDETIIRCFICPLIFVMIIIPFAMEEGYQIQTGRFLDNPRYLSKDVDRIGNMTSLSNSSKYLSD